MAKITLGELPARPGGTEAPGLTAKLWKTLTRCWHTNPEERIAISEILKGIRSTWVLSFLYIRDPSVLHLLILYSKTPGGERRRFRVGINKHQNNGGWSGWDEEVHVYLVHTFQHPRL